MNKFKYLNTIARLNLRNEDDIKEIAQICHALGNETRLLILKLLDKEPYTKSIPDLVRETKIPVTTLMHHINILEDASLIRIFYRSSKQKTVRIIDRDLLGIDINFYHHMNDNISKTKTSIQDVKIGQFYDFIGDDINFATNKKLYKLPGSNFYIPERYDAELLYTPNGIISYRFSNIIGESTKIQELYFSMEICSEAPYFDDNYLSDITFWINNKEITTYTLLGDYGDRRGVLNPNWWPPINTQYGRLLNLSITENEVKINGAKMYARNKLNDLNIDDGKFIEFKFGNKQTSTNKGGFNLFGKGFGDYYQNIYLKISYE